MAHFAQLDDTQVVQVIVVHNNELLDVNGVESEEKGIAFCKSIFGEHTTWKQTSYNNNFRKNFAGKGFSYCFLRNAFIPVRPYPSWLLDENTCQWVPPVAPPTENPNLYVWDEITTNWVKIK